MTSSLRAQCVICGEPVEVPFTPTGDPMIDEVALKIAGRLAHDACGDRQRQAKLGERAASNLISSNEHWQMLCPPRYQNSYAWLKEPGDKKKLNAAAVAKALAWEFGPKGLCLNGTTSGTGKTTSAWVILHREFGYKRFIAAMSHVDLSNRATRLACDQSRENLRWAETLRRADILFIDDLSKSRFMTVGGVGRASEEFLFDLLDYRINNLLPTILTCNLDGAALKASMSKERGEYFTRRLREFFLSVKFG